MSTSMPRAARPLITLVLCAIPVTTGRAAAQIDQAMLDSVTAEVLPAARQATGVDLSATKIRLVEPAALAKVLSEELIAQGTKPAMARRQATAGARLFLAKFAYQSGDILICPRNFAWQAKAIKEPKMTTMPVLRAVVVHECVHAADEQRFGWSKVLRGLEQGKARQAYTAVVEGHAQHVAATICGKQGWSAGFELYTSIIGKQTADADVGQQFLTRVALANLYAAYHDGRRFVAAVAAAAGDQGIAKVFSSPPADFEVILHPKWYFDPTLRPTRLYEFGKPLREFEARWGKDWGAKKIVASSPQLRAALGLLPKADVDRVLQHLKHNQMVVLNYQPAPGSKMVTAALYEFDSPDEALFYLVAADRLSQIKDAKMKAGAIRVTDSKHVELKRQGWRGHLYFKTVKVGRQTVKVVSLLAVQGSVAAELLYSNEPATETEIIEQAGQLLRGSRWLGSATSKPVRKQGG